MVPKLSDIHIQRNLDIDLYMSKIKLNNLVSNPNINYENMFL